MRILFLCVANSSRSQLAEGIARTVLGDFAQVESAGSSPGRVNSFARQALSEIGIDISRHWSKAVDDLPDAFVEKLDYVITLCAEEVCPTTVRKAEKRHWPLPDPGRNPGSDEEILQRFRATRDEIRQRLMAFRAELEAAGKAPQRGR